MNETRKKLIIELLKGIETGDPKSVTVVNPEKYIQHNPQTKEGGIGLAELFKELAKSNPRVNIVRVFSDADYIFAHTEYEFDSKRVGFEIFRFEGKTATEHWDNIQRRKSPNDSGHSMVDGATQITDLDKTETNRNLVHSFISNVLIENQNERLNKYISEGDFIQHNPQLTDDLSSLRSALTGGSKTTEYRKLHRLLAEGNFVLAVCEGEYNKMHSAFYDLYRLETGMIVEHWDTIETIPAKNEWKNQNGKF